jgi:glutaredoxin
MREPRGWPFAVSQHNMVARRGEDVAKEGRIMTSLLRRIFGKKPTAAHLTFTVYTRAECGCCHKAMDVLDDFRKRYGFRIEAVDVDGDPELAAKYGMEVPVVAVDGKVRFRGKVNPALLERLLVAEAAGRDAGAE